MHLRHLRIATLTASLLLIGLGCADPPEYNNPADASVEPDAAPSEDADRPDDVDPGDAVVVEDAPVDDASADAADPDDVRADAADPDAEDPDAATARVPERHRPEALACDDVRSESFDPPPKDAPDDFVACRSHAECQEGTNGRCVGNGHDGWYCTYDLCFEDAACGGFVCECGGGFRADNNVCLTRGDCLVDADCGAPGQGFCSPSLGDCGFYSGVIAYYCHTPEDECIDDADCGGGDNYCAYDPNVGRWLCSNSQCAG